MAKRKKQPQVPRLVREPRPPTDTTARTFRRGIVLSAVAVVGLCLALGAVYARRSPAPAPLPFNPAAPDPTPSPTPPSRFPETDAEYRRVRAVRDEWLASLTSIVERTHDPEASEVLDSIRASGTLAVPSGEGIRPLEEKPGLPAMRYSIVALTPADRAQGKLWASKLDDTLAFAFFQVELRAIVLKPDAMSPTWQGIVLAHEGYHALVYCRAPFDWHEMRPFYLHERDTTRFQQRLMLELGGPSYARCLQREQERLRATTTLETLREMKGTIDGRNPVYDPELDAAFGPTRSAAERESRSAAIWIHAFFQLIEGSGTPDPLANEAALMEYTNRVAKRAHFAR